jgi:DNA-binding HxlR family transcriptional regulator
LFHLSETGTVRFGVMKQGIYGISEKMLIQSLKELEKDGLVRRKVYRQVPPKVEYGWGKSYASYLVSKGNSACEYTPGMKQVSIRAWAMVRFHSSSRLRWMTDSSPN